jgi:hypothetical protein
MDLSQDSVSAFGTIAGLISIAFSVFLVAEFLSRLLGLRIDE